MEYYSVIKNENLSLAAKCMELEDIVLSKINKTDKDKSAVSHL
jgi:hypothetical protein